MERLHIIGVASDASAASNKSFSKKKKMGICTGT
jgi:hypothetical protein